MDNILKAVLAILALCGFMAFMVSDLSPPARPGSTPTAVVVQGEPPKTAAAGETAGPPVTATPATAENQGSQAPPVTAAPAKDGTTTFSVTTIDAANFGQPMVNPTPVLVAGHSFAPAKPNEGEQQSNGGPGQNSQAPAMVHGERGSPQSAER